VRSPFFTTKVVLASGLESGTPCLTGPPEMLCREIDPSRPLPASGAGVGCVSARATQANRANRIRNSSNDCWLFKAGWTGLLISELALSLLHKWKTEIELLSNIFESEGATQKKARDLGTGSSWRTTLPRAFAAANYLLSCQQGLSGELGLRHCIFVRYPVTECY
jgi:hypothetical protein